MIKGTNKKKYFLPFQFILFSDVLSENEFIAINTRLDKMSWEVVDKEFYCFNTLKKNEEFYKLTNLLSSSYSITNLIYEAKKELGIPNSTFLGFDIHKYEKDSSIGAHTDDSIGEARVVLNINKGWIEEDGGVWVLSNDSTMRVETQYLSPINNTAYGFVASNETFHALSRRYDNHSYAIVIKIKLN